MMRFRDFAGWRSAYRVKVRAELIILLTIAEKE